MRVDSTSKQNCFDDFIACADHLHDTGITSRERLAIMGGSNGGLLMGAVLTQRPDIARAVVAAVPVMDSLRAETTTNGRFNTPEFGTVEDPETFAALLPTRRTTTSWTGRATQPCCSLPDRTTPGSTPGMPRR